MLGNLLVETSEADIAQYKKPTFEGGENINT